MNLDTAGYSSSIQSKQVFQKKTTPTVPPIADSPITMLELEDVWLYLSSMAVRYLPHDCPLVEVQNTNTAVRAGEKRQEREELVDAGETRHRLAVLHTEQLPQLVLTGCPATTDTLRLTSRPTSSPPPTSPSQVHNEAQLQL